MNHKILTKHLITLILYLSFTSGSTMADGKILSTMERLPSIPDQQAVLIWDEESKIETLAIETRFQSEASGDYCWIIPTPGKPQITSAPANLMREQQIALHSVKDHSQVNGLVQLCLLGVFIILLTY